MHAFDRPLSLISLGLLLSACAPAPEPLPDRGQTAPVPTPIDPGVLPVSAYSAEREGFVVHEWGTLTSVSGSDGTLLPGLHHEEEDLPAFVADRLAEARTNPGVVMDPTQQKMETPVTYFYSPAGRVVTARVDFPRGMLTQFYPYVQAMSPPVYTIGGGLVDRYSQQLDLIPKNCQWSFQNGPSGGSLDWGKVEVLAPQATPALPGQLGSTTWGFARHTAANPLRVANPGGEQFEKFLFYRGLGNFDLPLRARFSGAAPVFTNSDTAAPMGGLFLMVVTRDRAGWKELGDLAAGAELKAELPEAGLAHDAFVSSLKARLAARLVQDGLYTDEAVAMVDTWERGYFLTPGTRLLYLLPQAHTDGIIPLNIQPAPDKLRRTMVIRVELLSPQVEGALSAWLTQLGSGTSAEKEAARASFLLLGRFAEPQLTRALQLTTVAAERAAGEALLAEVRKQKRWAPLAAE